MNASPNSGSAVTDISTSAAPRPPLHSVHVPTPSSFPLHVLDQLHCLYHRMSASFPPSLSLFFAPPPTPPRAPLICLTPLSDRAQQAVGVSTYWVHSRCQVLQQARQPCQGAAYTSVGFKSLSTTQIKAQHSRTSVSPFYSIWCSVYWQSADAATCLPPSRHNPIPPTTVSILESRGRCPLSAAEMIARLSGCDLFMLPIKLISPHIVVKA